MRQLVVGARGQVTIPKKLRERCRYWPGMPVTIEEEDGAIVVRRAIDPDQEWYWTPEWQEKIR
jgi:AbrB family looped-hinge helix DNA binding protein